MLFPMYTVSADRLLAMTKIDTHEELKAKVCEYWASRNIWGLGVRFRFYGVGPGSPYSKDCSNLGPAYTVERKQTSYTLQSAGKMHDLVASIALASLKPSHTNYGSVKP